MSHCPCHFIVCRRCFVDAADASLFLAMALSGGRSRSVVRLRGSSQCVPSPLQTVLLFLCLRTSAGSMGDVGDVGGVGGVGDVGDVGGGGALPSMTVAGPPVNAALDQGCLIMPTSPL